MIGFNDAWVKILKAVKRSRDEGKKNQMQLWRDTGIAYSHIEHLVKEMKRLGWIYCEKEGRQLKITLTKKGLELQQKIINIEAGGYFRLSGVDIPI